MESTQSPPAFNDLLGITKVKEFEFCPTCGGELDTGWECKDCGLDWRDCVLMPPVIEVEGEN